MFGLAPVNPFKAVVVNHNRTVTSVLKYLSSGEADQFNTYALLQVKLKQYIVKTFVYFTVQVYYLFYLLK